MASTTLRQLLAVPVVSQARPEVLHGEELLDRPVRWVHTSEIYEIASLLRGGEVLLVSGLGLVGADDVALTAYVDRLADRDVAGLFMELGRIFDRMPPALVAAAGKRDLPLVALHETVPFVDITYAVHDLLHNREAEELHRRTEIDRYLQSTLADGHSISEVLRRIGVLAGVPVELRNAAGRVVASSEPGLSKDDPADESIRTKAPVTVRRQVWGKLVFHAQPSVWLRVLAGRAAVFVGIALAHSPGWFGGTDARRLLLTDLAEGRHGTLDELAARAELVSFPLQDVPLVAIALSMSPSVTLEAARKTAEATIGRHRRAALVAETKGEVLLLVEARADSENDVRRLLDGLVADLDGIGGTSGEAHVLAAAASERVVSLDQIEAALHRARDARRLVVQLGLPTRAVLVADVAVYRLLGELGNSAALERFVSDLLGRIMDHDAARSGRLMATLEALVASGWSKTDAAVRLGVQRQTLYRRIERIETLIGGPIDDPERRLALGLALRAHLMRRSGGSAFNGSR